MRAYTPSVISLFVCTYNARAHTDILTLYHAARFRGRRLLGWVGWNMRRHFKGGRISRCSEISRKYGMYYVLLYFNNQYSNSRVYVWHSRCTVCSMGQQTRPFPNIFILIFFSTHTHTHTHSNSGQMNNLEALNVWILTFGDWLQCTFIFEYQY